MKCANCAKDNPSGARYCIHCGAEQALPTPIAAVAAAAMASGRRSPPRQAANAAQAEPITGGSVARESEPAPWQPRATSETVAAPHARAASPTADAAQPAYAALPRRTGLAVALVAACVVVAVIAFAIVRFLQPDAALTSSATRDAEDSVMSSFPPDATPPSTRRTPNDVAAPPAATGSSASGSDGASATSATPAAVQPAPTATETQAVEIRPLPARPAPRTTRRIAPDKGPEPPGAALAPAPAASAPAVVAAAPKSTTAARATDPWSRMREELSRCTREDFISRVICDQRVRFRYCKDFWGRVPECPGNAPTDHGQ